MKSSRRRSRAVIVSAVALGGALLAGCGYGGGYYGGSTGACEGTPAGDAIHRAFDDVGQTAKAMSIADRESHCEPAAYNRSGAKGLFQLLGHDDLIYQACPNPYGVVAWDNPDCNAQAARMMWNGSGWSAWGG